MKAADVRNKDAASLKEDLAGLKKEQFNLRFQQATGQLAKPSRMRDVRRDIARVMTVLTEKAKKD
jgi:large subunit ribosomal protein L29